ncbi:hypothetical protein HF324_25180 [Chitinophaga oryzae]|uniref:Uncharacterized protein n=1 Tax=Chitinophaga oryzae TaxID=2725414 RepID=A0ABX6LMJ1_9BACT|nr:hypothetical protein [Chitinophaga oryzae]QJB40954.2 hypothetical protein HF324_25180 [Chitinophaga oryzae]
MTLLFSVEISGDDGLNRNTPTTIKQSSKNTGFFSGQHGSGYFSRINYPPDANMWTIFLSLVLSLSRLMEGLVMTLLWAGRLSLSPSDHLKSRRLHPHLQGMQFRPPAKMSGELLAEFSV